MESGKLERSDSAFANGHDLGACVSDSLWCGAQTPDRTELDDSNPLRPSGLLSSLPGWRCHQARAICCCCCYDALVLESAAGYVSNSAKSGKDQLSPRPPGACTMQP